VLQGAACATRDLLSPSGGTKRLHITELNELHPVHEYARKSNIHISIYIYCFLSQRPPGGKPNSWIILGKLNSGENR
jgi:hypothetical protein